MYKFSIITYNFNGEKNIVKHLASLINIDYDNYEIILVDDCSDDNSIDIVTSQLNIRNNIRILSNKYYKGLFNSLNLGINSAKGKYLLFSNTKYLLNTDIFNTIERNISDSNIEYIEYKVTKDSNSFNYMNMIISSKVVETLGFFDTFDKFSDWDYKYRILKVYTPHYLEIILGEEIDYVYNKIDREQNVYFKNKFSSLKDRFYIPKDNWIKLMEFTLPEDIYSNLDIIIDESENVIVCRQYFKSFKNSIYKLRNIENKHKITISIDNNIVTILDGKVNLNEGIYNISYSLIDNKVIKLEPLYLEPFI